MDKYLKFAKSVLEIDINTPFEDRIINIDLSINPVIQFITGNTACLYVISPLLSDNTPINWGTTHILVDGFEKDIYSYTTVIPYEYLPHISDNKEICMILYSNQKRQLNMSNIKYKNISIYMYDFPDNCVNYDFIDNIIPNPHKILQ